MARWRHESLRRSLRALGLAALALPGAALATGSTREPNILMIVVDTLRQDHVGCYGEPRGTTPAIDALAAQGTLFELAYATSSWTGPSIASMLTGMYPSGHGLRLLNHMLDPDQLTLAEFLRARSYATGAVVSHVLLSPTHGYRQGFDDYIGAWGPDYHETITTGKVTDDARGLLEKYGGSERPFFLFVHYFDPHYTYRRHPEFGYAAASAGRLQGDESISDLRFMSSDMTGEEVAFVRDLYDEEIRHTDGGVARLLAALRDMGLADDTWVLLVADHGEEFLDHGSLGHSETLYEEVVRVPFIVRAPRGSPRPHVVREPVSLAALTPTVLDLIGVDLPAETFQGRSIAGYLGSGDRPSGGPVYLEVLPASNAALRFESDSPLEALVTGRFKLVRDRLTDAVTLYDLGEDPGEREDLAGRGARLGEMVASLDQVAAEAARSAVLVPGQVEMSPAERERLRSLGYLGP